jgi:hypothetical protein
MPWMKLYKIKQQHLAAAADGYGPCTACCEEDGLLGQEELYCDIHTLPVCCCERCIMPVHTNHATVYLSAVLMCISSILRRFIADCLDDMTCTEDRLYCQ